MTLANYDSQGYGNGYMGRPFRVLPRFGNCRPCAVEYESIKWAMFWTTGTHLHEVLSLLL